MIMSNDKNDRIETPLILTPQEDNRVFKFNSSATGQPKFVAEVPSCRFNGLAICLATNRQDEVAKTVKLTYEFKKLWEEVARRFGQKINMRKEG